MTGRSFIPLIAFLIIAAGLAIGLTRDPKILPSQLIDKPFPSFTLPALSDPDTMLTLQDVTGQVAMVNIFGSWCVACDVEHPLLMELAKQGTVTLIGINWRDDRKKAQFWLSSRGNPYSDIIFDDKSQLILNLGVTGAPETFIIDKEARIRYKHTGPITRDIWHRKLRPLIIELQAQ